MSQLDVMESSDIRKAAIATAFTKAATSYDHHAQFQRDVGCELLDKLPYDLSGKRVLDLGCGTGYFSSLLRDRGAEVICVDLSGAMLSQAKIRCGRQGMSYILGDAEQLPLNSGCVDFVFSSLALQWCDDLALALSEMKRVLNYGGKGYFSTLTDGSLAELRQAWAKVDAHQHVNRFIEFNQVKLALTQSHCDRHHLNLLEMTVWYESSLQLMRDLKGIGATHVNGRSPRPISRSTLAKVEAAYQPFRHVQGLLPATYQVCLGVIDR
jgi:malonyl-CoA O-methyltransferase